MENKIDRKDKIEPQHIHWQHKLLTFLIKGTKIIAAD